MRLARFFLLLGAFLALSSQLSPAFARRVEECKVERVDYLRGPSCAPEVFSIGTSMSCPDAIKSDSYYRCSCGDFFGDHCVPENNGSCNTAPACKSGYSNFFLAGNHNVFCGRPDTPASCRLPEFGVELYSACIPQTVWNDCAILKTRVELDSFLEQMDRSLPISGSLFLSNRALIAKQTSNANALACLVKNWDGDARYVDLVSQMKKNYRSISGQKYKESSCKDDVPESVSCAETDVSEVCNAQRDVDAAREFFKSRLDEVTLLIGDVIPSSEPAYRDRLESLAAGISEYLK